MVRSLLDVPSACPPKLGIKTKNRALGRIGKRKVSALEDSCGQRRATSPFVPEHLSDDARGCIDIIKQSMPSNVYSALDSFLLSAFAMAWATHKRAAHEIGAPDFQWTTASKRGCPQASPWIRIANQQAGIMAALGDRLGLDPKSRTALKLPDAKQRKSKFAGLMGAGSSSTYKN